MTFTNPVLFAKALADETRQKIMNLVCCQWLSVNEIVEQLNVTQPTVSHHLALLRETGLVQRARGRQTDLLFPQPGARRFLLRSVDDQVRSRNGNSRNVQENDRKLTRLTGCPSAAASRLF